MLNSELLIQKSRFKFNSNSDSESDKVANTSSGSVFNPLNDDLMSFSAIGQPISTVIHEPELVFATLSDSESEFELNLNRDF